jgi:hypothetical protein
MRSKSFRGNVFVANLPPELSDDALAEAFDSFGIVLSAHVARDPQTGERLRYGFVDIATERASARSSDPSRSMPRQASAASATANPAARASPHARIVPRAG